VCQRGVCSARVCRKVPLAPAWDYTGSASVCYTYTIQRGAETGKSFPLPINKGTTVNEETDTPWCMGKSGHRNLTLHLDTAYEFLCGGYKSLWRLPGHVPLKVTVSQLLRSRTSCLNRLFNLQIQPDTRQSERKRRGWCVGLIETTLRHTIV